MTFLRRELLLLRKRNIFQITSADSNLSYSKHQYTLQLKKWGFSKNGPNAIKMQEQPSNSESQIIQPAVPSIEVWPTGFRIDPPWPLRDEGFSGKLHRRASPQSSPQIRDLQKEMLSERMTERVLFSGEQGHTPNSTSGSDISSSGGGDGSSLTKS